MTYPPEPYTGEVPTFEPNVFRGDKYKGWQLAAGIVAFFIAEFVSGAVPILSYIMRGAADVDLTSGNAAAQLTTDKIPGVDMLIGMVAGAVVALLLYMLIMRFIAKSPGLGFGGHQRPAEFIIGLGTGAVLMAVAVGLIWLLGGYHVHGVHSWAAMHDGIFYAAAAGIGAGFMEEILFRGILLRILDSWLGSWGALAITSVLFGLMHVSNSEATLAGSAAIAIEAGILLGAAYLLTRRLWLAIGIHIAWNFVQGGVFGSDISGTGERSGVLNADFSGPDWLTGGAMGMEASIVTVVVATAAGVVLLFLAHRQGMLLGPVRTKRKG